MAWQNGALLLPLFFTLNLFIWLFPEASCGQNASCWWNNVSHDGQVSIECHANPPSFLQKCGQCRLRLTTSENTTQADLHQCSRNAANFTAVLSPQAMQDVQAKLWCPDQGPQDCIIKEGYPPPTCLIPDFEYERKVIHCFWDHHSSNLYNITLHWEEVPKSRDHGYSLWEGDRGRILRTDFVYFEKIRVRVSAESPMGSVHSDFADFHTGSIREPIPPEFTSNTFNPLEIFWNVEREDDNVEKCHCEVRYKNEWTLDWTEVKDTFEGVYVLQDTEPFTNYTFLVRCGFGDYQEGITMSNWSSYTVQTPAAAPVGKLDVWSNCEADLDEPICHILWKEMPKIEARSQIDGYRMSVKLNNGSELGSAEYKAAQCKQCETVADSCKSCPQEQCQCCIQVPLQDVKDIRVTANSLVGQSRPALVALPRTGLPIPEVNMTVKMKSQSLDVSWSAPQQFSESIQEYVVQYKLIGLPHQLCLDWTKVNKTTNSVRLKGQFRNYKRYNVSLFAVINNGSRLLQSDVVYAVQGVPPKVTGVKVTEIFPSKVKLTWKPIPLEKSNGFILEYLVGIDNHTVWNVSKDENSTRVPCDLDPGRLYEVWICGVTVAGEGERTTVRFTTSPADSSFSITVFFTFLSCLIIIISVVVIICCCSRSKWILKFFKVPDPINSKLFQSMNNQFRQSWLANPSEYTLTVSQVEVFIIPENPLDPEEEEEEEEELIVGLPQVEPQRTHPETDRDREEDGDKELHKPGEIETIDSKHLPGTNNYSQMLDSSEEEASRDDEYEEWEEQACPSDYEKHFMPCIQDA
ncbi:interleukin 12 receptor, beta 2a, like isoform X1 [Astyanax mexicanus]|uniref:interleukin 12 receptor, beta 2a, like isoform X1 n=1 Tax=Astyanax mexicanus TaxID=7994 RepID=UPI0020CB602C|nr:interleukin 12 receptor, beta 2a, like isoform X1 [Astyanax mexicanus]